MARITVEDCLEQIPNRFQLVLCATYRARMLSQGHTAKVESKNKPCVTALREIAAGQGYRDAEKSSRLNRVYPKKKHRLSVLFLLRGKVMLYE